MGNKGQEMVNAECGLRNVECGIKKPVLTIFDDLAKSLQNDGKVKISRCKARET